MFDIYVVDQIQHTGMGAFPAIHFSVDETFMFILIIICRLGTATAFHFPHRMFD